MKLMILTGKFGMGHWAASLSLKQQLERGLSAKVEVVDFFAAALPELSPALYKSFQFLVTYGGGLYNLIHILTEDTRTAMPNPLADALTQRFYDLALEEQPDAVIATHPMCAQLVSRFKHDYGVPLTLVTCITDVTCHSEWIHPGTDCYLVAGESVRRGLAAKGVDPGIVVPSGIPVSGRFHPARRDVSQGRELLIMGGGLGLMPRRDSFYQALNALPGVHTTILTGKNEKLYQRLHGKYANIEAVPFTREVEKYMARAHLMLSKPGGITCFEAIAARLPILAWQPFLKQEQENAGFLVDHGMARIAAKGESACLAAIRDTIYDDQALSAMERAMDAMANHLSRTAACAVVRALAGEEVPA